MRRSLCYVEPKSAFAGEIGTWKFIFQPSTALPKGTLLKFDVFSRGRPTDWEIPQSSARAKTNNLFLVLDDGKKVYGTQVLHNKQPTSQFEFKLPKDIEASAEIYFLLGSEDGTGSKSQTRVQRRRNFYLSIDPKGKGDYRDTEVFNLDVKGNSLHHIRIITPSSVNKNQRFDILIRFEDAHGNLTNKADEDTLIELTYKQLRDNINWKLFIPETGFLTLPNLYFNEPGVYRLQLTNLKTKEQFVSAPVKCFSESPYQLLWGSFHSEFPAIDAAENIESCLRHIRDEHAWQFFGTSPFESEEETSNDVWKNITTQIAEFNEDDRFTTFLGMQWSGEAKEEGHRQIVYLKDNKPILRKKDSKSNSLKKIYKSHTTKELFAIPSFTMAKGMEFNFNEHMKEFEPVVEIFNSWGSSECSSKAGNPKPIKGPRKGYSETEEGSIIEALKKNNRFGFVSGGFDDRGIFAHLYDIEQAQYEAGISGVYATAHTREGIIDALRNRNCFATTGARMILGFSLAEQPMGSQLSTKDKPGLEYNRHISGFVIGISEIESIAIYRNGEEIKKIKADSNTDELEFTFDDTTMISENLISLKEQSPFVFYYIKAYQKDGHIAWSSPIWVDHNSVTQAPRKSVAKKAKKKA